METKRKVLRPYQARLLTDVARASGNVLVEQPTGSGKTMQVVALVGLQLGRRFSHAVISAPQEQIEQGFVHRDYRSVSFPECHGVASPSIQVADDLIWGARRSELGSVRRLVSYLRQRGPVDHALACTHAALNRLNPEQLPDDLSGKALFIDEAHHASADGLSQIVSLWRQRGGQLYFFTATPYRADGRQVALDGMRVFRRSLAEHMAEGFAPTKLGSEIVALGKPGDSVTAAQFTGEEAPPRSYFDTLVAAICAKWIEDGKPKAILRVPPMRGGSGALVTRLVDALGARGARVLDATGTRVSDKKRFLAALVAEKGRDHHRSNYDVVVGIQRVMEGTDWPVCSAVYCVGMPGSLNTVVQLLGRAMRPKGEGYPASHRDHALLVFFVPCGGGSALADLSIDHSRHALLTCCFLADHEVGQEWIVLREIRRGIEEALGRGEENPTAADAENEADEALAPEIRAEVELTIANSREQMIANGSQPTIGELVQVAAKTRPDLPDTAFHRVAAEILATAPGSTGAAARKVIRKEVAKRLRIDPMVKQAMSEAFAVVLAEFRNVTLKQSPVLESVRRQVHGVTGGQMQQFAQRLRDAAPRPLTAEQILAWSDAHYARTGQWPNANTGFVSDVPGETWNNVDRALWKGLRGLPGTSSLAQLLAAHRGVRNRLTLDDFTGDRILKWADAHHDRTGQWPQCKSGSVLDAPGETWSAIDDALRRGTRGLEGGCSLAQLLAKHRSVRNTSAIPDLSVSQVLNWADAHHRRTGRWPQVKSGRINDAPSEKWANVNAALQQGLRGLPAGSSLAKLLADHRGMRNPAAPPSLTLQGILAWADASNSRSPRNHVKRAAGNASSSRPLRVNWVVPIGRNTPII